MLLEMKNLKDIIKYSTNMKLLYVEDDEIARDSTMLVLEDFFDDITLAVDGKDGLEKYNQNHFDIIITDINMPRLSGLEMTDEIRKKDTKIPILILSAHNETDFFMDSIKHSIEGYLLKPINIEQFLNILEKVIEKLKLQEEAQKGMHLLHQYQQLTDKNAIVSKMNTSGLLTYANNKYCHLSGYNLDELLGKPCQIIRHPDFAESLEDEIWETINDKKELWHGIIRNQSKNGTTYYVRSSIKPILDKDDNVIEFMGIHYDISDIMNPKKQLQDLIDSTDESMVVIIKIEEFDDIEKYYGHLLSQKIENTFADNLLNLIPKRCEFDKIYILGNGEYAFAKDNKSCNLNNSDVVYELKTFQKKIDDLEINIDGIDYDISILISFANGKDALDNAKYGLKELLRTNSDFIQATHLIEQERILAEENIRTLKMVKRAIERDNIISYFQPIIDNKTQEVEKYESLVRLINDDGDTLAPYFFLDIAKKGKYYTQITHIVLQNSFNALKYTNKGISINLSALDIEKSATRERIFTLIEENKKDAHRIIFEFLEDERMKDLKLIQEFVKHVKTYGIRIAIDDFGTGYSNFKRLLNYQPDILKIDGNLVKDIETNTYSLSIVKTIVAFAKEQNIKLIAEYVENQNIYNILNSLGVDYSQGYYFGKPDKLEGGIK